MVVCGFLELDQLTFLTPYMIYGAFYNKEISFAIFMSLSRKFMH